MRFIPLSDQSTINNFKGWVMIYEQFIGEDIDREEMLEILRARSNKSPPAHYLAEVISDEELVPVGFGTVQIRWTNSQIEPAAYAFIYVDPAYRRRGVGSGLLELMKKSCNQLNLLFFFVEDVGSQEFLVKQGGQVTEKGSAFRVYFSQENIMKWKGILKSSHKELDIKYFKNPEDSVWESLIKVYSSARMVEPGSENIKANSSIDSLKALKDNHAGVFLVIAYQAGEIVGFSYVLLSKNYTDRLFQGYTGVDPKYQKRGFATLMKSHLLTRISETEHEIKFLETENLHENIPMLRVNSRLGFKKHRMQNTVEIKVK